MVSVQLGQQWMSAGLTARQMGRVYDSLTDDLSKFHHNIHARHRRHPCKTTLKQFHSRMDGNAPGE